MIVRSLKPLLFSRSTNRLFHHYKDNKMLPTLPKNYLYAFGANVQKTVSAQMIEIEEESTLEESSNDILYKTVMYCCAFITLS